jgi:DNA-binding MarR family transcriptional regulator
MINPTSPPTTDPHLVLAAELRVLIVVVAKMAGRDLEQRLLAEGFTASPMQCGVMRVIDHLQQKGYRATLSSISKAMLIPPPTLVPIIDALERDGLLRRQTDPADRRRTLLLLEPPSQAVLAQIHKMAQEDIFAVYVRQKGLAKAQQLSQLLHEFAEMAGGEEDYKAWITAMLDAHTSHTQPSPTHHLQPKEE